MRRIYLDSSAAAKLVVAEAETSALAHAIEAWEDDAAHVIVSELVATELWRGARRASWDRATGRDVLAAFDVVDVTRSALRVAGQLEGVQLRTLDALHIAIALEIDADAIVTYDARQGHAARLADLATLSPGASG
ncbi:MAG: type II toxin-antitoxin system VapC family toxin [Iamia sp.]